MKGPWVRKDNWQVRLLAKNSSFGGMPPSWISLLLFTPISDEGLSHMRRKKIMHEFQSSVRRLDRLMSRNVLSSKELSRFIPFYFVKPITSFFFNPLG